MINACKIHGPLGVLNCICRDLEREAAQRQATAARIADLESRLAQAERERDDKDRQLDEALGQCVALGLDLGGTMRERDSLRGHYDAVREQVIVVTQRLAVSEARGDAWHADAVERARDRDFIRADLAAARKALEQFGDHLSTCAKQQRLNDAEVKAVLNTPGWEPPSCTCGFSAALAASPAPCASCGQDPAGGHNLGCPDGAGLGNE